MTKEERESAMRQRDGLMSMDDRCIKCKELPYPRGFNREVELCWWCQFKRA